MFVSEYHADHRLVMLLSALGMLITIVAAVINVVWLKGPLYYVFNMITKLNLGILPEPRASKTHDEIGDLERALEKHIQNQREIVDFARAMEEGDFSQKLELLGEDDLLRASLLSLENSLEISRVEGEKRRKEDENRTWAAQGLARFSSLLRANDDSPEKMAVALVRELVDYTVANVCGLFIVGDEGDKKMLKLIGSYAFDRQKFIKKQFAFGEGLVGRVAMEKEMVYLTDIPEDYLKIRSGLGEDKPGSLLLSPVILDDSVIAVLELASFEAFPSFQLDFIKSLSETIAITLSRFHA